MKTRLTKLWREWMKPLFVVLLITSAFRSAVADWYDVPTGSMKPTIIEGDRIFVNKLAYDFKIPFTTVHIADWSNPQRGEVVVFYSPADGKRLVKRVVGMPGDLIEMRDNRIYVNGRVALYEPLDRKIVDWIPRQEQPDHTFAAEEIENHSHPVMLTPAKPSLRSFQATFVPTAHYFVMGDNRDNSFDSRWFGFVERSRIVGRASTVVASLNPDHYYAPRWHRFFTPLP